MMKQFFAKLMLGALLVISLPVIADEHRDRERHWEGREIHRFREHDFEIWQRGRWVHGRHEGQRGWWWVAAGTWYFYPSPVYPYPDPYTPPVVVFDQQPPVVVAPQVPMVAAPQTAAPPSAPSQAPAQNWYYCESSKGYYPYVPSCKEGWKSVPAQPPQVAPQ